MDDRYRKRGYSATFTENESGASLDIRRNGKIVCGIGVGIFSGGRDEPVAISIKRFQPSELRNVVTIDEIG